MTATTSHLDCSLADSPSDVVHRYIAPQAGHALEKLAHAIEYLSDEFMLCPDPHARGRLEAIQLLMELNREIYSECPQVRGFAQRVTSWFRRAA